VIRNCLVCFVALLLLPAAVYGVYQVKSAGQSAHLVSLFGVLAVVQWLTILILPLVQVGPMPLSGDKDTAEVFNISIKFRTISDASRL